MQIENTEVYGFRAALRAMRNPMDSWDKSDTEFGQTYVEDFCLKYTRLPDGRCLEAPEIGPADLKLACKLIRGGSEHRKFLRQIIVWVDFTLPRYVWQELDTYKVATVRNSCSTMHKLGHRALSLDDFEDQAVFPGVLAELNAAAAAFREKRAYTPVHETFEGYDLVRWMKAVLPESFLQKATYTCSYETLLAMYRQRHNHRLPQWSGEDGICAWIRSLPYMGEFIKAATKD